MRKVAFLHRIVGVTTVIVFLATGQYMSFTLPPPDISTHLTRMLYRSAHVYLLLSGLVNIAIGTYLMPAASVVRRRVQFTASILLLIAPAVILFAFFHEPPLAGLERPVTLVAMIALLAGTTLHLLTGRPASAASRAEEG